METNFNFKSSVCTSREQSERLLALGLKKETADMCWHKMDKYSEWEENTHSYEEWVTEILPLVPSNIDESLIPAWSLHRLMILAEMKGTAFSELDTAYETTISIIAAKIRFGYFNKEYLEE